MMAMDLSSSGQDFEFDVPQDQLKLLQAIPGWDPEEPELADLPIVEQDPQDRGNEGKEKEKEKGKEDVVTIDEDTFGADVPYEQRLALANLSGWEPETSALDKTQKGKKPIGEEAPALGGKKSQGGVSSKKKTSTLVARMMTPEATSRQEQQNDASAQMDVVTQVQGEEEELKGKVTSDEAAENGGRDSIADIYMTQNFNFNPNVEGEGEEEAAATAAASEEELKEVSAEGRTKPEIDRLIESLSKCAEISDLKKNPASYDKSFECRNEDDLYDYFNVDMVGREYLASRNDPGGRGKMFANRLDKLALSLGTKKSNRL